MMVMFFPIARVNFIKDITGTDFPTIIKYHRCASHLRNGCGKAGPALTHVSALLRGCAGG